MISEAELLAVLEQQVELYRRLLKLAEVQHEHVQQDQTEPLLDVLQKRAQVLEQVAELEKIVRPVKQHWNELSVSFSPAPRARAESLVAETRELLQQITQSDQNDALVLQQRKLNIGRELRQAAAGRQINRTYAAAAYGKTSVKMDVQR